MRNYKNVSEYSSGLDDMKTKRNVNNNKRPLSSASSSNDASKQPKPKKAKTVKKNMDIFD